jgi:hypothetical protein
MTKQLTVADLTARERERIEVAFHEAGHAVAATILNGRIRTAVVGESKTFGVAGKTVFDELPAGADAGATYGGPWAQARWQAGGRPGTADIWRVLDASASDYEALCAAGGTVAAAGVVPALERCWPSIAKLAGKLFVTGEIRHSDVCAALGIPETDNGHHLALIRSGSAPGSFTVTPAAL